MTKKIPQEFFNLKTDLESKSQTKRIEAIKLVISYMNIQRDVSSLFFSVIKCLDINSIEIKKLIYLYITNYSNDMKNDCIMAINFFVKDAQDKNNPLIRALAVRTMGCLRIKEFNEYLVIPLKNSLKDSNSYVQKTAIMCVPKVYEISPELIEKENLIESLSKILEESENTMVIAKCVTALMEISKMKKEVLLSLNKKNTSKILISVNDCNEWNQIILLDFIAQCKIKNSNLAELIFDRILSRLSHINPSVVLGCIKVILTHVNILKNDKLKEALLNKIVHPFTALINGKNETSWLSLKIVNKILVKYPKLFQDYKIFLIKYSDSEYIKKEKLNIIFKITSMQNYKNIIEELQHNSYDINYQLSRLSIRKIWNICLKYDFSKKNCRDSLEKILKDNINQPHIINEITEGLQYIVRKYNQIDMFSDIIKILINNEELINEKYSKIGLLYLISNFDDLFDQRKNIIEKYIDICFQEDIEVQIQILNSVMKICVNNFSKFGKITAEFLQNTSEKTDNSDLRDKAFIYWRLLNADINAAKEILNDNKQLNFEIDLKKDNRNLKIDNIKYLFEVEKDVFHIDYNGESDGEQIEDSLDKIENQLDNNNKVSNENNMNILDIELNNDINNDNNEDNNENNNDNNNILPTENILDMNFDNDTPNNNEINKENSNNNLNLLDIGANNNNDTENDLNLLDFTGNVSQNQQMLLNKNEISNNNISGVSISLKNKKIEIINKSNNNLMLKTIKWNNSFKKLFCDFNKQILNGEKISYDFILKEEIVFDLLDMGSSSTEFNLKFNIEIRFEETIFIKEFTLPLENIFVDCEPNGDYFYNNWNKLSTEHSIINKNNILNNKFNFSTLFEDSIETRMIGKTMFNNYIFITINGNQMQVKSNNDQLLNYFKQEFN